MLICLGSDMANLMILCPAHLVAARHCSVCPLQWVSALWVGLFCLFSVRNYRGKKRKKKHVTEICWNLLFVKKCFRRIPEVVWLHPEGKQEHGVKCQSPGRCVGRAGEGNDA